MLFVISDFIDYSEHEAALLGLLSKKYDIFAFIIRDKVEQELPNNVNAVCIKDPHSDKSIIVNIKPMQEDYKNYMIQEDEKLANHFLHHNINVIKFITNEAFEVRLYGFFEEQKKQWR